MSDRHIQPLLFFCVFLSHRLIHSPSHLCFCVFHTDEVCCGYRALMSIVRSDWLACLARLLLWLAVFIRPGSHRRRSAHGHSSSPADRHLNPSSVGRGREIIKLKQTTTRHKVDSCFCCIGALYTFNHTLSAAITRYCSFLTKVDSA